MADEDFKLGFEGVLYIGTNGRLNQRPGDSLPTTGQNNFTNATWSEYDNVTDVDGDYSADTVDTTTRAEAKKGWASNVNTTKAGVTKFGVRWKPGGVDANFDQLRNAWLGSKSIPVMDLDGAKDVDGSQGLVANMSVSFSKKKPVKGVMMVDVTLTVQSYPDWVVVNSSGVLVAVDPDA